ncbi:MAG TPA: hypothetical protein PLV55_10325 [Anaerohalosphaeraceae bacterium]|nr:hypothetical protein [Anaerohalosphaeraceae bacterium]
MKAEDRIDSLEKRIDGLERLLKSVQREIKDIQTLTNRLKWIQRGYLPNLPRDISSAENGQVYIDSSTSTLKWKE